MRNVFVVTGNVELVISLTTSLEKRDRGIPGLGLIFGEPGLGKTRTLIWLADRIKAVFIRALAITTTRSFLEQVAVEVGQQPAYRTTDIYRQVKEALLEHPKLIIIDEIDRLCSHWQAIEVIRDLSDETGVPILMIGMSESERKLARFKHVYYRMKAHVLRFKPLSESDVRLFADQVCEVELEDSAISEIFERTGGRIGDIIAELYNVEKLAKVNNLSIIKSTHLRRAA